MCPLHVACAYRANADVIQALVDANPIVVGIKTSSGAYPLHLMCDYGGPVESLLVLLRCPYSRCTRDQKDGVYHRTPLSILNGRKNLHHFNSAICKLRRIRQEQAEVLGNVPSEHACLELQRLSEKIRRFEDMDLWRKARALFLASEMVEGEGKQEHPFDWETEAQTRAVLRGLCTHDCPGSIQELALLLYQDQLCTALDDCGNLLIHLLCQANDTVLLQEVLRKSPACASIRNAAGLSPLQVYLRRKRPLQRCVLKLIEAFPEGLTDLNLFPSLIPQILHRFNKDKRVISLLIRC